MKKIKIITAAIGLCVAASLFAGCNNQTGESAQVSRIEGGQTKISVENGGSDNAVSGAYKFSYKGYDIVPGADIGPVIDTLGEPVDTKIGASCAGQGFSTLYSYSGFTIYGHEDNGVETVEGIEIDDPLIDCGGVRVGQTLEDAKKIYGEPFQEDDFGVLYRSGSTELQINSDEFHTIISIMYRRVVE